MFLHVIHAAYDGDYKIKITFNDGRTGTVNLLPVLKGPVFDALKNIAEFRKFRVDEELATIVWENGADFAPEYLYYLAFKEEESLLTQFKNWGYCA